MAKGSFLGCVFVVIVLVLLPLHSGELSLLSTSQRQDWSNWVNSSQNTSSEVFWIPNIASSSFVELLEAGSRSKSSSNRRSSEIQGTALGSPLMSSADLRSDSDLVCDGLWHRFRSLCWTPVPPSVTLYDASQADRYCSDRGARVLIVARHHFCVQGAERLSDYSDLYNQIEPLSSAKHKRIMGNNGY